MKISDHDRARDLREQKQQEYNRWLCRNPCKRTTKELNLLSFDGSIPKHRTGVLSVKSKEVL